MSAANDANLPKTIVVAPPATAERDVVSIRIQKQSLIAQLQSASSDKKGGTPEELLAHWPVDPQTDPDAARLVFEDFRRRREQPGDVSISDYEKRFPEHKATLAGLVQEEELHKSLGGSDKSGPRLVLPEVGDKLFGFQLLHELGRGSFARVFLAAQEELAGRQIVLKVSNLEGDEPQTLALLQHTHIVPIYSIHEDKQAGLRAVCMPYFGGASLAAVLLEAGAHDVAIRTGEDLVRALLAVQVVLPSAESAESLAGDPKVLAFLKSCTYPRAAAWIAARLAEGLQHSHNRGVIHRDIKPSNILLGMDGQPLLLDFNLAQVTRGGRVKIVLGGTINYMAPEHLHSIAARDHALARHVDHRADIYSLGMVLFEMLVGHSPFAESASDTPLPLMVETMAVERGREAPSLRAALAGAPWNLESILRKCLAPNPADRYQKAEHVADDLQRFLDDRPLRYAPELSVRERWRKWRRRHPRLAAAIGVGSVAAVLLATLGAILIGTHHLLATTQSQLGETQDSLERATAQEYKRAFHAGAIRALCLVNTTVDGQDLLQAGRSECERTLGLYQVLSKDDWQDQPAFQNLTRADRQALADDARELVLLLAWARVAAAPRDPATLEGALALLSRAEKISGIAPLRALWEDRALYWERLGETQRAESARASAAAIPPKSARDHYLLATSFARGGRYTDAIAELNAALQVNPDHYWSLVQRGICYRERGELVLAAGDFGRCVGLEPNFAWGHYNLGCILDQHQKHEEAIASYGTAIHCDGNFALAYLNRGLAFLDLKQHRKALADLDAAANFGRDDAILHLGRGAALEELRQPVDADTAFSRANAAIDSLPPSKQSLLLLRFAFAVSKRLPAAADAAFVRVLDRDARQPQALYGKAMLLVERQRESDAIACFNEALLANPAFIDARRFRAVLLARQGKLAEAQDDINRCLDREPSSGITLYAAACVLARAASQNPDQQARRQLEDQALDFLEKALHQGYGSLTAATDPDLAPLQHRAKMQALSRP